MKSITLFTEEADDVLAGVEDLLGQLEDFALLASSVGLLFVPTDVELEYLTELLQEKLGFPVMGATCMAMLNDKCGFQSTGLSLQIFTADDCEFTVGITDGLTEHNLNGELGRLCQSLKDRASGEPRLVITYLSMLDSCPGERYIHAIEQVLPGVPVYGGAAADDFSFEDSRVFCGTDIRGSGAVVLLVSGNVRPALRCVYSTSREMPMPGKAVCENGYVSHLGNRTLIETLQTTGLRSEKIDVIEDFVSLPLVAEMPLEDGDSLRLVRTLKQLDHKRGSAIFLGEVREGTTFSVSVLDRESIHSSLEEAFGGLVEQLEQEKDYQYSTVLCTSCAARYMLLAGNVSDEGDVIMNLLPGQLSLSGMYSFGEICPILSRRGKEYNVFHNTAFIILAM